jgi:hypothetical protein
MEKIFCGGFLPAFFLHQKQLNMIPGIICSRFCITVFVAGSFLLASCGQSGAAKGNTSAMPAAANSYGVMTIALAYQSSLE